MSSLFRSPRAHRTTTWTTPALPILVAVTVAGAGVACNGSSARLSPIAPTTASAAAAPASPEAGPAGARPVHVVVFTHIEDNTPMGPVGTPESRTEYLAWRPRLVAMAELAQRYDVPWVLQPDWKFLEAALAYEDAAAMASTGGLNVFRYLRERLGVVVDPHSHENGGYNYADVAYLLERLGVGGSTVVGGHIWDPAVANFGAWDRFRAPLAGERYPQALWRGDILMGAASPGHVRDPIVSGVWRPRDRSRFFEDDPLGNIVSVGGYSGGVPATEALYELGRSGAVPPACMLTLTHSVRPADLTSASGLAGVERDVLAPLASLRGAGRAVATDFTNVVAIWRSQYGADGCLYQER